MKLRKRRPLAAVRSPRGRIHLLEVGLGWPPQTFLQRKLESLVAAGFRITVVSVTSRASTEARLPGVALRRLPEPGEHPLRIVAGVVWNALALLLTRPARLSALIGALRSPIPGGRRPGLREAAARLPAFLPLARILPDVVHLEWPARARFYLPLVGVWARPYVISCHGSDFNVRVQIPGNEEYARSLPVIFARAAAIHCVSQAIEREGLEHGLAPAKSWVIRSAVDPAFFSPAGRDGTHADELRMVSVGPLRWQKGREYALLAIRQLLDDGPPVRLDIVGDGPDHERILCMIADLAIEDHVRLHGQLTPKQVRERLNQADVLLHSSVTEGLPTAILEAMACGLPVVATDCGGVSEAVTDGVEGFLVPPRAPRQLADALRRLRDDPVLRRTIGRAARTRIESEFTLAGQTERFVELYEHVIHCNGRR